MSLFKDKKEEEEKKKKEEEELQNKRDQEINDVLSDFTIQDDTPIVKVQNYEGVIADIALDKKEKSKVVPVVLFSILMFFVIGFATFTAITLSNYKFVYGIRNVEGEALNVAGVSVIDRDYKINRKEIKVGDKVYFKNNGEMKIGKVQRTTDRKFTVQTNDGNVMTLSFEKLVYKVKEEKDNQK
jgi:hypothetical protein